MNVKRNILLLLTCLVWIAAGFNIFRIGFIEYKPYHNIINYLLSILVFVGFQIFIFTKPVKKHTERIGNYTEEKHLFIKFFDGKSFVIMAFMMILGIVLRYGGLALKELRLKIAREENMPPYIIFNDKTLIDMCVKLPTVKSEMLNVSGVGENKYSKYGESYE